MTQRNTPYPSTACLTGFLRSRGVPAFQEDLALARVLWLLSPEGLRHINHGKPPSLRVFVMDTADGLAAEFCGQGFHKRSSMACTIMLYKSTVLQPRCIRLMLHNT
ncbi:MAG: hypothetical protein R3E55_12480 [Burkholderiaceae bacterium]